MTAVYVQRTGVEIARNRDSVEGKEPRFANRQGR